MLSKTVSERFGIDSCLEIAMSGERTRLVPLVYLPDGRVFQTQSISCQVGVRLGDSNSVFVQRDSIAVDITISGNVTQKLEQLAGEVLGQSPRDLHVLGQEFIDIFVQETNDLPKLLPF